MRQRALGLWVLALAISVTGHASSIAEKTYLDFTFRTGITQGKLTQTTESETTPDGGLDYGGIPLALYYNLDVSRKWTMLAGIHLVADFGNGQVTQTGLHVGFLYHLMGGARRLVYDTPTFQVVSRQPYNFSLAFEGGYDSYAASSETGAESIKGQVFETMIGLQYRTDISENGAFIFELLNTFFSLPASVERTSASRMEVGLSYRFFL